MSAGTIDHKTLSHLVDGGNVNTTTAIADGDKWALVFKIGKVSRTLTAERSREVKIFKKLDTVAKYLSELGITHFEIDSQRYDPTQKSHTRPDKSTALKAAHEAANLDTWLREDIAAAVNELEKGNVTLIPHEDVMRRMEEKITKKYGKRPRDL